MKNGFTGLYLVTGIIILFLIGGGYYVGTKKNVSVIIPPDQQRACTQEAKICPDGSSVGRTGVNCEFSPCPATTEIPTQAINKTLNQKTPTQSPILYPTTSSWKSYSDSQGKFSIKYPPYMMVNKDYTSLGMVLALSLSGPWDCAVKTGETCLSTYNLFIYNDYDGGSRREWFNKKFPSLIPSYQAEEVNVDGTSSLVLLNNETSQPLGVIALIPQGNKMYLIYFYFQRGAAPQSERLNFVKQILSTFKFN